LSVAIVTRTMLGPYASTETMLPLRSIVASGSAPAASGMASASASAPVAVAQRHVVSAICLFLSRAPHGCVPSAFAQHVDRRKDMLV
jgi:hypothetical protein